MEGGESEEGGIERPMHAGAQLSTQSVEGRFQ